MFNRDKIMKTQERDPRQLLQQLIERIAAQEKMIADAEAATCSMIPLPELKQQLKGLQQQAKKIEAELKANAGKPTLETDDAEPSSPAPK